MFIVYVRLVIIVLIVCFSLLFLIYNCMTLKVHCLNKRFSEVKLVWTEETKFTLCVKTNFIGC